MPTQKVERAPRDDRMREGGKAVRLKPQGNGGSCLLCSAVKEEGAVYEDEVVKILRTKNLKGHKERIMVVSKSHNYTGWIETYMLKVLEDEGKKAFDYTYKFVILATDYASVPDHPHFIATDLEPSEDHLQILGTRWNKVVEVKPWVSWRKSSSASNVLAPSSQVEPRRVT